MGIEGFLIFSMYLAMACAAVPSSGRHCTTNQKTNVLTFVAAPVTRQAAPGARLDIKGEDTHG